jgi:hypothetical protein
MMKRHDRDLQRLRELRHKREQRALEEVAVRRAVVANAEVVVANAAGAVADHTAAALKKEREVLRGLLGKTVRQRAIARVQSDFEATAHKHNDLRRTEATARQTLRANENELRAARDVYRKHRLETEKLRLLLAERNVKHVRRETAVTESATEDQLGRGKRSLFGD